MSIQTALSGNTPLGDSPNAVRLGNLLFTSGQLPIDPVKGVIESPYNVLDQAHQVMTNLECLLEANGITMQHVAKCTIYLRDLNEFEEILPIFEQHFKGHRPARSIIQAAKLPEGARVMVDVVAEIPV